MKRLLTITLTAVTVAFSAHAQQQAHYSQYMTNKYLLNPAVAGSGDWADIKVGFRTQWVGFDDAPQSYYLTGHVPIGRPHEQPGHHTRKGARHEKHWHGIGGYIYNDQTGPTSRRGFYASYTYNMKVAGPLRIAMGVFAGTQSYVIDGSKLTTNINDANPFSAANMFTDAGVGLNGQRIATTVPDMGVGFWSYSDDFYFGISAFQLLQSRLNWDATNLKDEFSKLQNHYFVTGGIRLPASEEILVVPSFLLKALHPAPLSVDLNLKVKYRVKKQDRAWGGLSYRSGDSFVALAGVTVPLGDKAGMVDIGYSFDLTTSRLRTFNSGTHEIVVGYRLPLHGRIICASQLW